MPAQTLKENSPLNQLAAIYARVSSDQQKDEETIGSQIALLTDYAHSHGYTVPPEWILKDEGYSGSVLARPGLERLRDLAAQGQIEAALIYDPDRFSRNYAYQTLVIEELSRHGVQVLFLKGGNRETPEGRLLLQLQGMIAEYERAQIMERSRRGKRFRAQQGRVNVLCGAPYGYRYIRKTDTTAAAYEILENEAAVVRKIFAYYTQDLWSIGAIARQLNEEHIPTRQGKSLWERSTVWGLLKNPAYMGKACFGKTEVCERQRVRVTRPLRQRGGFSPRAQAHRDRPREQWIEIAVPAIIEPATFALAQERLAENKRLSARHTKQPTLLQGLLVCGQCGYGLYRTSTRTTKRQVIYYRCLGSDRYRHLKGPVCSCRPIRQDYLEEFVWNQMMELLQTPHLVQAELERRLEEYQTSDPVRQRQEKIAGELKRLEQQKDKLLDAYQENLVSLTDLRKRMPELKQRQAALEKEQQSIQVQALEHQRLGELKLSLESFLESLQQSAKTLDVKERQKIIRLIVKDIIVHEDTITINHRIPVKGPTEAGTTPSYRLCTRGNHSIL